MIAINDTHRLAPWADCLYSSDQQWWRYHQGVPEFAGRKYGIAPLVPHPAWGITVLVNTGQTGIETDPRGLRTGRNSGYASINLAVHVGARRVVLLGFDMGRTGGRGHFFGEHPSRLTSQMDFAACRALFQLMVDPLRTVGVEVVNASRQTALTMFPRVTLEEALA